MGKKKNAAPVINTPTKAKFRPLTEGQKEYWECLNQYSILFCDGPAGSGKTFTAAAKAVDMLLRDEVQKIIIARPPVGTTKKGVGFLPGNIYEKLDLYMRPVVDEIQKVLDMAIGEVGRGREFYFKFITEGRLSIESLDHIRGNNFHECFMILDECENADRKQIDAFVSRAGKDSRVVICGDSNQTDLVERRQKVIDGKVIWVEEYNCDFANMWDKIWAANDDDIGACELTDDDIVRSPILKKYLKITK